MRPSILKHFRYKHLPDPLQSVSKPFCEMALDIIGSSLPDCQEREVCLRKLLEAKDCAVRAYLEGLPWDE